MRKYWMTLLLILVTVGVAVAATLDSRTEKTAPADPDILYMLQSPYGSGDDRKVTYDSFQSQIDHVGTIDTGVWHGTSVSDDYIDDNITVSSSGTVDIDALGGATLGNLLVGNGSDFDSVAMSGDITITSAGVTSLDTSISSTWTGTHTFTPGITVTGDSTFAGQLLADGAATKPAATYTVCSSTAQGKDNCDYTCDGTADDVQIQAAIDALDADGGEVALSEGTFTISSSIVIAQDSGQFIVLSGVGLATIITRANSMNADAIQITGSYIKNGEVKDMYLLGNKANNTSGHGIYIGATSGWYDSQFRFADLFIEYFDEDGFSVDPAFYANELRITNVYSHRNDGSGFLIWGADSKVINSIAGNNSQHGFEIRNGNGQYTNCKAYGSNYTLADTSSTFYNFAVLAHRVQLVNCQAQDGWASGFYLGGTDALMSGCQADTNHNDATKSGDHYGILVSAEADNSVIVGNVAFDKESPMKQDYGLRIADGATECVIAYNNFSKNLDGGISASVTALAANTVVGNLLPTSDDEWLSMGHDLTKGFITSGKGGLTLDTSVTISGNTTFNGTTTINSLEYTWPASQSGTKVLQNDGSGTLTWATDQTSGGGSGTPMEVKNNSTTLHTNAIMLDFTTGLLATASGQNMTVTFDSTAISGDVTFVANISHIGSLANVPFDNVNNSPTVDNFLEYTDYVGSAGFHTGCAITDSGSGQIDIAECEGLIRPTSSTTDSLVSFKVAATTNFAITDDSVEYIYVDYNSGTPQFVANSSYLVEATDMVLIGGAVDEGGDIITEWNEGVRLDESIAKAGRFLRRIHTLIRDVRVGGLAFTDGGSSNTLELSAGSLWRGRTEYTITAKDTDAADTFREYYRDGGGGWTQDATETTWDNYYWDDGTGTLNDLGANRWGVHWLYITADDAIHLVYGREQHNSSTDAETQAVPSSLPDILTANGVLAARLIFQRNDTAADSFASSFDMTFNSAGAGDITDVGDCTEGACLDGTSAGGTYVRLYDGDSNYTEINNGDANQSADLKWILPDTNGTAGQVLEIASVATNTLTLEWDDDTTGGGGGGATKFLHTFRPENAKLNLDSAHTAQIDGGSGAWKLRYDADTIETASWMTTLDTYSGGGFTGTIHYTMASGTSDEVEWQIYMDCLTPNVDNSSLDTNTWGTADVLVDTVSANAGRLFSISDSSLLDEDSCALGDIMRVKIDTDADDGTNDDATGDRELRGVTIEEN